MWARPRPRHSLRRQLFQLAGPEKAPRHRIEAAVGPASASTRSWMDPPESKGAAGQNKARLPLDRGKLVARPKRRSPTSPPTSPPIPRAPAQRSGGGAEICSQGLRRQAALRRPLVSPAAGRIVSVIGPSGAGKTTLFPHDYRAGNSPTGASFAIGETVKLRLCRPVARQL